jgi:Erv1 / Alr family
MEPKVWGKYIWTSIHMIALGYPDKPTDEDKMNYKQFYINLWKVIPCYKCSVNYQKHLEELPIDAHLNDNMSLFKWTVDFHNIVNKELGKKEWTFEETLEKFRKIARGEDEKFVSIDSKWDSLLWWSTLFIIIIVFVFITKRLFNINIKLSK